MEKGEKVPLTGLEQTKLYMEDDENFDKEVFMINPFDEEFDRDFWYDVSTLYGNGNDIKWTDALNEIRVKYIKKRFESKNIHKDPLICMMVDIYDKFKKCAADLQIMASFKQQLAEFARRLLSEENSEHYGRTFPDYEHNTVLHFCAERDLYHIAVFYLELYPKHVYVTNKADELPVELALKNRHDDTASLLLSKMLNQRVRKLFLGDALFDARFKFCDIINEKERIMTKTVVEILEACLNPDWPFTPYKDGEEKEEAWARMPDISMRYHFYYRLLDGDQSAEPAQIGGKENNDFKHSQLSCLQLLANSPHRSTMYHPVVRKLVDRKWSKFGQVKIMQQCFLYVLFLVFLTCAFYLQGDTSSKGVGTFRNVCEVLALVYVLVYTLNEIDEMEKERRNYLRDPFNYLDLLGLVLILALVPLRCTSSTKAERAVAACGYLINCLRVFKFFPANKNIGTYTKTIAHIIYKDITKFALVYGIVFFAFGGTVYMSSLAAHTPETPSLPLVSIFLKEFRAFAEGNPFNDDYDSFNGGVTFLIMCNMIAVIVVLANILIGQVSNRYDQAVEEADIQYSIDKTKFICRLESNRFRFLSNRIKYYVDGDYVSEEDDVKRLLKDWETKKQEMKVE